MDQGFKRQKRAHPKETANFLSLITFFYNFQLFKNGWTKDLEQEDLYEVLASCQSKKLGDQLEQAWLLDKKKHGKAGIGRVLWTCFGKTYILFGIVQLIMRTIFVVFVPEALGKLVSYFAPGQTALTRADAIMYASIVIGLNIVQFVYTQNYHIALTEFGIRVRTAICSFIYRKTMRMTENALADITMGKIVTLLTKDLYALEMLILFGNDIWIGLVQTAIICFLIYMKIGAAAFAGVGFFMTVLPLQIIIGKLAMTYRLKSSQKTDERLSLTQEVLSAIKIIKMYAWEEFFTKKIASTRKKEIKAIYVLFYMKIIIIILGGLSSKIAFYLLIMTYVWLGNNITAEIVYFVFACFGKLKHLLSFMLPLGISFGAEAYATLIRLESVLEAEELPPAQNSHHKAASPKITLDSVAVTIGTVPIFNNIALEIEKGLNAVVGHMGCGKTTFLKTILECYKYSGNVTVAGRVSYASQEPWLFPSSIRNNITFGESYSKLRYDKVLEMCDLNEDFGALPAGDQTIVGDRGVNLSKGQQARVNLARAVYKEADIYLLDDCLAALDGHVSDFIFKNCMQDFLKDKLVLFVTNNHEIVDHADKIIVVEKGGARYADERPEKMAAIAENKTVVKERKSAEEKGDNSVEKNIYNEVKKSGKVEWGVYHKYIGFGGGYWVFGGIMLLFVAVQSAVSYSDKVVSNWVTIEQNLSTYKVLNLSTTYEFIELEDKRSFLLNLYTGIIIASTVLALFKFFAFFSFNRHASIKLHKTLLTHVMNAKMYFFDSHFIGNILNRFAKDLCTIDDHLPFVINECFEIMFILLGIFSLVAIVNPIFIIPAAVFFIVALLIKLVYQKTGRSLQRLEASTRSPLLGHLNASFDGLATIRAFRTQEMVIGEFDRHQDLYTSASYTLQSSLRALAFVLDGMSSFFTTLVIVRFLAVPFDTSIGGVGLAITQAIHLSGLLQHGIRRWADFENQMTSVERVLEYAEVPQEEKKGRVVEAWPEKGAISYEGVSLDYGDGRKVLRNINLEIETGQKIGIVGRTGCGKSSLIATLFRLYDIEGRVRIDGVDTGEVALPYLRSKIGIIPQDPILFSGTIRENIDPMRQLADEEVWRILKVTKLEALVGSLGDLIDVKRGFSAGQKQLVCLARAMAKKSRIIVLDEATANLDKETDLLVREVVEESFKDCTVLVIAHRLSSIMASDFVMVVDNGEIVEFDKPEVLLANRGSLFFDMVKSE